MGGEGARGDAQGSRYLSPEGRGAVQGQRRQSADITGDVCSPHSTFPDTWHSGLSMKD